MKNYYDALDQDPFETLPVTFHIKEGIKDPEFQRFKNYYYRQEDEIKRQRSIKRNDQSPAVPTKNIWIIKPGELTN